MYSFDLPERIERKDFPEEWRAPVAGDVVTPVEELIRQFISGSEIDPKTTPLDSKAYWQLLTLQFRNAPLWAMAEGLHCEWNCFCRGWLLGYYQAALVGEYIRRFLQHEHFKDIEESFVGMLERVFAGVHKQSETTQALGRIKQDGDRYIWDGGVQEAFKRRFHPETVEQNEEERTQTRIQEALKEAIQQTPGDAAIRDTSMYSFDLPTRMEPTDFVASLDKRVEAPTVAKAQEVLRLFISGGSINPLLVPEEHEKVGMTKVEYKCEVDAERCIRERQRSWNDIASELVRHYHGALTGWWIRRFLSKEYEPDTESAFRRAFGMVYAGGHTESAVYSEWCKIRERGRWYMDHGDAKQEHKRRYPTDDQKAQEQAKEKKREEEMQDTIHKAREEAAHKAHEEAAKALDAAKKEHDSIKVASTALAMAILDGAPEAVLREQAEFFLKKYGANT